MKPSQKRRLHQELRKNTRQLELLRQQWSQILKQPFDNTAITRCASSINILELRNEVIQTQLKNGE